MPPHKNKEPQPNKKKKKGHSPAHQNTFAWAHNPKSKQTSKILAMPNVHVCRRCHDKIEWRKQYRKYKPRTQPGTCNGCKKRNVLAAYHTVCEACTRNCNRAKEIIQEELERLQNRSEKGGDGKGASEMDTTEPQTLTPNKLRACAMCVKEVALPDPQEEGDDDLTESMGRIRLRERRALERKQEKEAREAKLAAKQSKNTATTEDVPEEEGEPIDNLADTAYKTGNGRIQEEQEEDPFLQAVGGADKLLTGKAYQEQLLAQQQQQQQQLQAS